MESIRQSYPEAKKEHQCNFCCGTIPAGQVYHNAVLKYDGQLYEWKSHLRCDKIADKLDMFDRCDEGVTDADFYEFIMDKYTDILGEENEPAKFIFQDRLDVVCRHFEIY